MIRFLCIALLVLCLGLARAQEPLGNGYQFSRPVLKAYTGLHVMISKEQGNMLGMAGIYDLTNLWYAQVHFGGQLGTLSTTQSLRPNVELQLKTQMRTAGLHVGKDVMFWTSQDEFTRVGVGASATLGYYWLKHQGWEPRDNGGLRYSGQLAPVLFIGDVFSIRAGYEYASETTVNNNHFFFFSLNGIINTK